DLARWTNEGALEYLGRIDHQVKIRGLRIELGEIEAQLVAQSGVREAVVTAQEGPGGTRLIAYVTAHTDHAIEQATLREALLRQLPDYMVPSTILVLDALPLSPNGKVDRKALPAPEYAVRDYEAPEGEAEAALAQIWSEVLSIDPISRTDNFFELGGDSILAIKLVSRIRKTRGIELPLQEVFKHPVLADLAPAMADAERIESARPGTAIVRRTGGDGSAPLSHAQERLWFLWRLDRNSPAYNTAGAIRLRGELDIGKVRRTLAVIHARHQILHSRFEENSEGVRQRVANVPFAWSEPDLSQEPESLRADVLASLLSQRSHEPFDLERGPLLRVSLVKLAPHEHVLHFALHHIVSDAWSLGILTREFA
ncbi:condensation domain-containing protein, partial [Paraburkholderia ferrariae]|uniref:condensation domain-containing protein n=1 Tax=Paraburkholderia ferrariae TaxID=386056 RepID=UPI000486BC08